MPSPLSGLWNRITGQTPPAAPPVSGSTTTVATARVEAAPEGFDRVRGKPAGVLGGLQKIGAAIDHALEKQFLTAHDGFLAFDPATGAITPGVDPSAVEHEMPRFHSPLDALIHSLAPKEHGTKMRFSAGGVALTGSPTARDAEQAASLNGALGKAVLAAVPAKGGLGEVAIGASDKPDTVKAKVLALPRSYDGPIFVSDIDDTLRATNVGEIIEGERQKPIDGVSEILGGVANMGVPIIYLSAGTTAIHAQNEDFLKQLPAGILLDNQDFKLDPADLDNHVSALHQAAYKTAVLEKIKATYPNAKIFGIGDDKYGDAIAYTNVGATAYIHDVKPDHANIPAGFSGIETPTYTADFRAKVLGDLEASIAASKSFET